MRLSCWPDSSFCPTYEYFQLRFWHEKSESKVDIFIYLSIWSLIKKPSKIFHEVKHTTVTSRKILIDFRLNNSKWKIVKVSNFFKAYTILTSLTDELFIQLIVISTDMCASRYLPWSKDYQGNPDVVGIRGIFNLRTLKVDKLHYSHIQLRFTSPVLTEMMNMSQFPFSMLRQKLEQSTSESLSDKSTIL